ncbi:MAG: SGNH/GDSL hydrolase family protein, partial [Planctomycetaceae bacterium]|nr:SGNH/GDSL hydrolase family protein [Planctomycetaceae bacterium]
PIGSGPAGPAVDPAPFQQPWTEQPVVLLGLGDSITDGFGASPGHSYFNRLLKPSQSDPVEIADCHLRAVFPQLTADNAAISGSTSLELLDILLPRVETFPDEAYGIVVLTTGGNDIIHHYGRTPPREGAMFGATWEQAQPWIDNYHQRLHDICDDIGTRFPGGYTIFLANIYDPTDNVGDTQHAGLPAWPDGLQILTAYNDIIAQVASERPDVELVDIHTPFLGHGIHCRKFWGRHYHYGDPHYWYFANLEDPNDRGYDAIRRLYLNKMAEVLPEKLSDMPVPEQMQR